MSIHARLFYSTAVLVAMVAIAACSGDDLEPRRTAGAPTASIGLTSPAFDHGADVPVRYTCDGEDVAPELTWTGVPQDAESLALVVDDPDAPGGSFIHWVLYGLPPDLSQLSQASAATARQGRNDFGRTGYGGPCPPGGAPHRYFFRLYALDTELDLADGATGDELRDAMTDHILAAGELMGVYERR